MNKAILQILFLLSIINYLHAETWDCISSLENIGMPENYVMSKFVRVGDTYMKQSKEINKNFDISQETNEFILLTQTYDYPGILVSILNKNDETYQENYISLNYSEHKTVKGFCMIIPDEKT